jgi:hypothetical protein
MGLLDWMVGRAGRTLPRGRCPGASSCRPSTAPRRRLATRHD